MRAAACKPRETCSIRSRRLAVAQASSGAKYRTQLMVAALGAWSRGWLCRLEALHAVQCGNYAAAFPLIRSAVDFQGAMTGHLESGAEKWRGWLDEGGLALAPQQHAMEYRLHPYRSGQAIAEHAILGPLFRVVSDFALPHFGATLLIAANGSDPARVAMTFGDRDFHLGLAELAFGWLLDLSAAQCNDLQKRGEVFAIEDPDALASFARDARVQTSSKDRCRVEVIEDAGIDRYLVHNWRAKPGAAAKKILL